MRIREWDGELKDWDLYWGLDGLCLRFGSDKLCVMVFSYLRFLYWCLRFYELIV